MIKRSSGTELTKFNPLAKLEHFYSTTAIKTSFAFLRRNTAVGLSATGESALSERWLLLSFAVCGEAISVPIRVAVVRVPGTIRRRILYLYRYLLARAQSKTINKFRPLFEKSFQHPWVVGVELSIRFWPGNEWSLGHLWRWYDDYSARSMSWDAPITVSIFRKRKGKKRQALCMSLYLVNRTLYVGQIQGVLGTDVPTELRAWPKMFMEICRTFARQESLREVRIPRAETLYSYRNPFVNPQLLPESRDGAPKRIRRSMKLLYDANALELGFVADGDWFKWKNANASAAVFSDDSRTGPLISSYAETKRNRQSGEARR